MVQLASSFRDPAGFVFTHNNKFYRFIDKKYLSNYELLMSAGLYKDLADAGRLIPHEEVNKNDFESLIDRDGKVILPVQLPFISYPYEWSFDMWKDAAVVTLKVALIALEKGMTLKDATPFNIQFYNGRPVFIDTLSFEIYAEGKPWVAYRQFCECFLHPLLLMHYGHRDLGKLFLTYPDGIPADVVKAILPVRARFNVNVWLHLFLRTKLAGKSRDAEVNEIHFSEKKLRLLLTGLAEFVKSLKVKSSTSEWNDYYKETILGQHYLRAKTDIFLQFVNEISFRSVIDLGANDGHFSLLLREKANHIVAVDFDSNCINALYRSIRKSQIKNIVPVISRLNHPTPAIGWANAERPALTERLQADLVLALAVVHHLAIGLNIPLAHIASLLHRMGEYLMVEFVPKQDEKVQQLLSSREDIFADYNENNFAAIFEAYFTILFKQKIGATERVLFLMKRK